MCKVFSWNSKKHAFSLFIQERASLALTLLLYSSPYSRFYNTSNPRPSITTKACHLLKNWGLRFKKVRKTLLTNRFTRYRFPFLSHLLSCCDLLDHYLLLILFLCLPVKSTIKNTVFNILGAILSNLILQILRIFWKKQVKN